MSNVNRKVGKFAVPKLLGGAVIFSALALAGCAGPTYGTGTPAEQQLLEDLTGALSLAPDDNPDIDYEPRPGLVKPASTEVLPPPQEDVANGNPAWPESPEQRLARVRAEATENQDNPFYRPNIVRDVKPKTEDVDRARPLDAQTRAEQSAEFRRRQQLAKQGSSTSRRYLSDPPLVYRQPADTAPVGEMGEDEWEKERARKRKAGKSRSLFPWLN